MATLASSLSSSIDLLATEIDDDRSSPVREFNRAFKRAESIPASARLTPTRSSVLQLQDFYIATPNEIRSHRASPSRSIAESENIISPWRIRVRVEAERDDEFEDNELEYRIRKPMSTSKARSQAKTVGVPLNDDDDDDYANSIQKKSKRKRKSMMRRPPTPRPVKSRKRVLAEIENQESVRAPTPKRSKFQETVGKDPLIQPSIENDVSSILHLDDLLEAAMNSDDVPEIGSLASGGALEDNLLPLKNPIAKIATDGLSQSRSPFRFRRQGQDTSIVTAKTSVSDQTKAPRKILISDFAEPRQEYDSIMEGEDFTMISLSSVPSAQQHLSLGTRTGPTPGSNANAEAATSKRPQKRLKSVTASPTVDVRTGAFKTRYAGRRVEKAKDQGRMLKSTSAEPPQQNNEHGTHVNQLTYSSLEAEQPKQKGDSSYQTEHPNVETLSGAQVTQEAQVAFLADPVDHFAPSLNSLEQGSLDLGKGENHDTQAYSDNSERESLDIEGAAKLDQPPDYLPEDLESSDHELSRSNHTTDPKNVPGHTYSFSQSPGKPSLPEPTVLSQENVGNKEGGTNLNQSSILYLPQTGPALSQLFSSPVLPNLPSLGEKLPKQSRKVMVDPPALTRAVKAGRVLQDVVKPMNNQSPTSSPKVANRSLPQARQQLFSGFSVASRRELQAGLRLGEELAKAPPSPLDITMESAPSLLLVQSQNQASVPSLWLKPHKVNATSQSTTIKYPTLSKQIQTHLPSPETSSNDTEQRQLSRPDNYTDAGIKNFIPIIVQSENHQVSSHMTTSKSAKSSEIPTDMDEQFSDQSYNDEFQDEGFPSDNDEHLDPTSYEETDVWQLEARVTSDFPSPMEDRQSENVLPQPSAINLAESNAAEFIEESDPVDYDDDDEELGEGDIEVLDFDEEQAAISSHIHTPTKIHDILTPSQVASSHRQHPQLLDDDFTNFTKDLQQAAKRQMRQTVPSRVRERNRTKTPPTKILEEKSNPYADTFTTKSLLETSTASIKPHRSPVRKNSSFRPNNRKESWLFDPKRLRKPPSPLKQFHTVSLPAIRSESMSPPPKSLNLKDDELRHNIDDGSSPQSSPETENHVPKTVPKPLPSGYTKESISTPEQRFADSSPLAIFVAAAQKAKGGNISREYSEPVRTHPPNATERSRTAETSTFARLTQHYQPFTQQTKTRSNNNEASSSSRPTSSTQTSQANTAQSSYISTSSANTSKIDDDSQISWLSLLTSVTTPLLATTKAITQIATTAFQQSQQQTFYPINERTNQTPSLLTTHQPFNDAHWLALRQLYNSAINAPDQYPLDLQSHCAEYIGLEIESLGWRRELEEWELAVVVRFLRLLREIGVRETPDQPEIDVELVIKRVFSLWVGMVTRGEADLTDGKAGAWDRRFVGKRDEVLKRQREWVKIRT